MFESGGEVETMGTAELALLVDRLTRLDPDVGDAERVDRIALLERLKGAAGAAQVVETAAFTASQRGEQVAAGVPARKVGAGIAAQVALARRESPARAARFVGWAQVLVGELPATFAALQRGETTEWRAMIVARETVWLTTAEQRREVDAALAALPGGVGALGDREVEAQTRRLAYQLDPHGYLERSRNAVKDRRVTIRPAPDTMTRLSALLPAAQGVAAYAALRRAADAARAAGDERGRGQVMVDILVERVTGQATADGVPVEITLVMTDKTLRGHHTTADSPDTDAGGSGADEAAYLDGYGPIPAGIARDLIGDTKAKVWLRRLYTAPDGRRIVGIDSRRRCFTGHVRRVVIARDQVCRTPWCSAPIRHTDHPTRAADGGETTLANGQGLCEACNYAKEAHGWITTPGPGPGGAGETVIITTPTGHTSTSHPPPLPGETAITCPPLDVAPTSAPDQRAA